MRPEQLAASVVRDGGRVVLVEPGTPHPIGPVDTALLVNQSLDELSEIAGVLDASADGSRVVVLLPCQAAGLPVGRIVDVLARHRGQVLAVVPVDDRTHPIALLLERGASAPSMMWLSSSGLVDLEAGRATRLRAELVVGGAAERAEARALQREAQAQRRRADAAEVRADAAEAAVASLTQALHVLRTSRSYQVGQALAQVRSAPMSGIGRLPGRLRRAGKPQP